MVLIVHHSFTNGYCVVDVASHHTHECPRSHRHHPQMCRLSIAKTIVTSFADAFDVAALSVLVSVVTVYFVLALHRFLGRVVTLSSSSPESMSLKGNYKKILGISWTAGTMCESNVLNESTSDRFDHRTIQCRYWTCNHSIVETHQVNASTIQTDVTPILDLYANLHYRNHIRDLCDVFFIHTQTHTESKEKKNIEMRQ